MTVAAGSPRPTLGPISDDFLKGYGAVGSASGPPRRADGKCRAQDGERELRQDGHGDGDGQFRAAGGGDEIDAGVGDEEDRRGR